MRFLISVLLFSSVISAVERPAGLYIRLNQKAVDYISELASDAFPALLNNLSPPDVEASPAKISQIHISNVSRPVIKAKFLGGKGVRANITLPTFLASAYGAVDVFVWKYEGGFMTRLKDLGILLELHFVTENVTTVAATVCNVTHSDLLITFPPTSTLSSLREEIETAIVNQLKNAVCNTAVDAINYILQSQRPSAPLETEDDISLLDDDTSFSTAELGADLCTMDEADGVSRTTPATLPVDELIEIVNSTKSTWDVDLTVKHPPTFTDDDVVVGFDGGIIYNGWKAESALVPSVLNKTLLDKRMVGIMLSDYIPNTLFTHIYVNDLGTLRERFGPNDMPKFLQKLARAFCGKCYVEIRANLTEQPKVEINGQLGVRAQLAFNVSVTFRGREQLHDVIHANAYLHVTLKPTIRHSRLLGDVSLTNVDVNVFDLGIGGPLATPIEKVFSFIVPRILWPQVKKRLRFAMNRRGIKLPVVCGVEFDHMTLDYVNHAAVLNTDFSFDMPRFVRKFKNYVARKAQVNPNLPRYVVM
ncbi:unnamed protein product [Caenorhabditis auriculariae]|uniref:Lipid-binding serum glycoprotein C-terminal domain-containing protein n=1 Tax=Caenorhabditis auriculariae TaxID=2777116 RepID=A0A8S1GUC5_9PELO|nr:unnamed protein product [Caenorhabditis auriculariae]